MPVDESLKPKQNIAQQLRMDRVTRAIIYRGCSLQQLSTLFGLDSRTVAKKLDGVEPWDKRGAFPVWRVRDAAPYLCTPVGDFETYLKTMHHKDLPSQLTKEFWSALRIKQQYEEEKGDLWRTDFVIAKFSQAFQTVRTALLLLSDSVEREVQFSERQRELLKSMVDAALEECRERLVQNFSGEEADDDDDFAADAPRTELDDGPDDEAFWSTGPGPEDEEEDHGL